MQGYSTVKFTSCWLWITESAKGAWGQDRTDVDGLHQGGWGQVWMADTRAGRDRCGWQAPVRVGTGVDGRLPRVETGVDGQHQTGGTGVDGRHHDGWGQVWMADTRAGGDRCGWPTTRRVGTGVDDQHQGGWGQVWMADTRTDGPIRWHNDGFLYAADNPAQSVNGSQ